MSNINETIKRLINYAKRNELIVKEDIPYTINRILEALLLDDFADTGDFFDVKAKYSDEDEELLDILTSVCDYAYENKLIDGNSADYRDLFDTKIMGILTPRPSEVIAKFNSLYEKSPEAATDYFYKISRASDYIRAYRVKKDLRWTVPSEFGEIDISINLSKPEKDPRAIAAAKLLPQAGYPKCLLCRENEGYAGRLNHPARQNLRLIPLEIDGCNWYLQYSPYVYYNEHCIALNREHIPMVINRSSFAKLLDFVDYLPHYFIGSNADLPIVGGSILSHDHMQGGRYTFAMERAEIEQKVEFDGYDDVEAGLVKWPMSVIRLIGVDKGRLVDLADKILNKWRGYTDEAAFVFAETDGEPHNTITPIARKKNGKFELDLVLRNNITTDEHPMGLFHPHSELHNIKKENIGLIEVMGLAVLPSRLKSEMQQIKELILEGKSLVGTPVEIHKDWLASFAADYSFTEENTDDILRLEIGKTFVRVLLDAGVYKRTKTGREAFLRFTSYVNK